jgi:DNA repair exonuclease SbcCD ATPase subunit
MQPIKLRLRNFCQYKDFTYHYTPGICGITGNNGRGKSNFIDAGQYFAITGEAPDGKTKSELLQWGADSGYTEFTFSADGIEHVLTRQLDGSKAKLEWSVYGESSTLVKQSDINKRMQELLGMTYDVFKETCFVSQGKFLEIIDANHSNRMGYFTKICGVAKAEQLRSILQGSINELPLHPDRSDEIKQVEGEFTILQADFNKLESAYLCTSTRKNMLEPAYNSAITILGLPSEVVYQSNIQKASEAVKLAESKLQEFTKTNELTVVEECTQPTEDDMLKNGAYMSLKQLKDAKSWAYAELAKFKKECPAVVEKPTEELRNSIYELEKRYAEMAATYKMAVQGVCPTCKREYTFTTDPTIIKKEYEAVGKELKDSKEKWQTLALNYSNYLTAKANYDSKLAVLDNKYTEACSTITITEELLTNFDKLAYEQQKANYANYKAYKDKCKQFEVELRKLENDVELSKSKLEQAISVKYASAAEYTKATEDFKEYVKLKEDLVKLVAEKSAHSKLVQMQQLRLTELKAKQIQFETVGKVRRELEVCRDVLHRDNLPKLVMRRLLVALNVRLGYYLEQFKTNFAARLDDDFCFLCDFTNGQFGKSAKALSGGQKVALALAFRFALSDVLGSSVPLLVMDEPTVFLDEVNVESVRDVLDNARKYVEKGTYVMVATHAQELKSGFTKLVEIGDTE